MASSERTARRPSSRAANYTLKNCKELALALRDVRIPLDNNRAENAERIIALGRKNFLFVQSEEAGKELALLYSLVVSCDRVGKNPVTYLTDVLHRIDRTPRDRLADCSPIAGSLQRRQRRRPNRSPSTDPPAILAPRHGASDARPSTRRARRHGVDPRTVT